MPRLFVALPLPAAVRARLERAVLPLRSEATDVRWTPAESWHITLVFLGSVPGPQIAVIEDALAAAAQASNAFRLGIDGTVGRFSSRVLWAAVQGEAEALGALAGEVQERLAGAGVAIDERGFHAHVTLARARRGGRVPRIEATAWEGEPAWWQVTALSLQQSWPGPGGARYEELRAWPLMEAEAGAREPPNPA